MRIQFQDSINKSEEDIAAVILKTLPLPSRAERLARRPSNHQMYIVTWIQAGKRPDLIR